MKKVFLTILLISSTYVRPSDMYWHRKYTNRCLDRSIDKGCLALFTGLLSYAIYERSGPRPASIGLFFSAQSAYAAVCAWNEYKQLRSK